ncbi:MAG: hypothetical protein HKN94_03890 [Acidimicrobiales bacterium]|nr:hypothetical protein [Acidimicrobiales bacterium]
MDTIQPSRWPTALVALLVGVAIGASAFWYLQRDTSDGSASVAEEVVTSTAEAETRDLRSYEEWAGVLQSGPTANVTASTRGTVTRNAEVGAAITLGDAIAEIDGQPVVALYGAVPQFRALDSNSDDGADIRQLEENLVALGYDPDGTVTVDEDYTTNTGLMVERWETDLGFETPDTIVDAGQIAFVAGPSEVASRTAVGSLVNTGQPLLTAVTLAKSGFVANDAAPPADAVTFPIDDDAETDEAGRPLSRWEEAQGSISVEVDVDESDSFPLGLDVEVELPDGQVIAARVESVSDVARTLQQGQNSITVVDVAIQPLDELDSSFTTGPVVVRVEDQAIIGATVIPVRALVALAEGGHAVEVEGRGLVGVELGSFDDGWVEITNGAIAPGETLTVPA